MHQKSFGGRAWAELTVLPQTPSGFMGKGRERKEGKRNGRERGGRREGERRGGI